MHCKIFELSKKPIKNRINEDTFMDGDDSFVGSIADYVQDIDDTYEDAIKALLYELGASAIYNKEENSITIVHKNMFLKVNFDKFKELTKDATYEQFNDWYWVSQVQNCLTDKYGTYIYYNYPKPIDDFMREVKDGDKFYIGGILDYHY